MPNIFAISDLHLGFSADKPMNIFGGKWDNYEKRMKENWNKIVKKDDIVLIPGDISWATYIKDAKIDFDYIESLNGTKIISKGNHDYWWETLSKLNLFLEENNFKTICFIHNTVQKFGDIAVCGTKGYPETEKEPESEEEKKLYNRELMRLKNGILNAKKTGASKIIVMLHYPPGENTEFAKTMQAEGVSRCVFGHVHGGYLKNATEGNIGGINYSLVSCDFLKFIPLKIDEY